MNKAILIGAGLAVLGVPALAQMVDGPGKLWTQSTTRAEAEAKAREKFAERDTNKDGFVTPEEIRAGVEARMAEGRTRAFDRLDADKNGAISREEFTARPPMDRMVERRIERRGPDGAKDGKPEKREMRVMMMRHGGPGGGHMIMMTDGDKDGRISQAEAVAGALKMFDQTDTNNDGTVTAEERRAAMQAWGAKMRDWGAKYRGAPLGDTPPPPPQG